MRRIHLQGICRLTIGVLVLGGLLGCPAPPQDPPPTVGVEIDPGEGTASQLGDDIGGGIFRVIPLGVTGCDEPGDTGGTVQNVMPELRMWSDQRVAWVIVGRNPNQRWRIQPKASQPPYFNNGSAMNVAGAGQDAYFTAQPSTAGECEDQDCEWEYSVVVRTMQDGSWQNCAVLDPKIKIRDRTM